MNDALRFPAFGSDTQEIELGDERMLLLDAHAGTRVRVLAGSLWLTEHGRSVARLLRAREETNLTATGQVVLQGAGATRIEVTRPARPQAPKLIGRIWRRPVHSAARVAPGLAIVFGIAVGVGAPELLARGFQKSGDSVVAAAGAQRSSAVRL